MIVAWSKDCQSCGCTLQSLLHQTMSKNVARESNAPCANPELACRDIGGPRSGNASASGHRWRPWLCRRILWRAQRCASLWCASCACAPCHAHVRTANDMLTVHAVWLSSRSCAAAEIRPSWNHKALRRWLPVHLRSWCSFMLLCHCTRSHQLSGQPVKQSFLHGGTDSEAL